MNERGRAAMDDRISLRPTSTTMRLGPSTDFYAAFRTGAGKHLRSKNRESQWDESVAKKPEERIRYSRAYLLRVKDGLKELPPAVNSQIACFVNIEAQAETWTKGETQHGVATQQGEEGEKEPEWRHRDVTAPVAELKAQLNGISEAPPPTVSRPEENLKVLQLQKAEELGREAYRPRQTQEISDDEKAVRQVNGTLNKLTPDNFDRLVQQITGFVKNAEVVRKTISLVFEKAVAEPTFCALYATLCERLSKQIPDFPPLEGETQKLTFRRVLLNTCQDEFEGVETSRSKLASIEDPMEREAAEKTVKDRTLGNVRLISELFNKGLVAERIIHSCVKDLLHVPTESQLPHEDNLEAVCELLTLAGKKLAQGQMYQSHVPAYMTRLERFAKTRGVASRIVFLIRDVMDMKGNDWVPRREKFTAKKIEEIHAEAETELGIQLKLPQPRQPTAKVDVMDDAELFPMPKGLMSGREWKAVADRLSRGPAAPKEPQPTPPPPPPTESTATPMNSRPSHGVCRGKRTFKGEEDRERAAVSMYKEYLSSADKKEAQLCAEEIIQEDLPSAKRLVYVGLQEMFGCVSDRDHSSLVDLLVWFVEQGVLSTDAFLQGVKSVTDQLDDLALDVPKSPELCGRVAGRAISDGHCEIRILATLCSPILSAEIRRPFTLAAFKGIQANGGDVAALCRASDVHAESFLKADASFDVPDLESVAAFLEKAGFGDVPL